MRLSDSEALGVAKRILGPTRLCDLKGEVPESRTRGLQSLRDAGLTMKQILSDSEALGVAKRILGPTRLCDLKGEVPESRTRGLQSLRDAGLTMKQIQRCTGIGRGIIYRTTHG